MECVNKAYDNPDNRYWNVETTITSPNRLLSLLTIFKLFSPKGDILHYVEYPDRSEFKSDGKDKHSKYPITYTTFTTDLLRYSPAFWGNRADNRENEERKANNLYGQWAMSKLIHHDTSSNTICLNWKRL